MIKILKRQIDLKKYKNYKFKKIDITNHKKLENIFKKNKFDCELIYARGFVIL